MEGVGQLFYLLKIVVVFFNLESHLNLMFHFVTAGKFWSIINMIKFQKYGQTRKGDPGISSTSTF